MRAVGPVAPLSYGMLRLPESTPEASAASDPSARSAGGAAGQLSGPCKLTVTVSPGCQPLPWIGTGVLQLYRSGWKTLFNVTPPAGVMFDCDAAGGATAIVTVLEVAPPMEIATGTESPAGAAAGTSAFTRYSPTKPGGKTEQGTDAATPPMVTSGVVVVSAGGLA